MKKTLKIIRRIFLAIVIVIALSIGIHLIRERVQMKNITGDSRLCAVYKLPELEPIKDQLIYTQSSAVIKIGSHFMTLNSLDPNGNILYGLDRVRTVMKDGAEPICVYSDDECSDDAEKKNANILFFPSLIENSDKPFVVVIAGGGYAAVSNLQESYPVARKFNELGYPVFVLNYRIDNKNGLFPKPMEDLAQALEYIYGHYNDFELKANHDYIVGGFSAGGHISAEWGTDNEGYLKYGLPAPKALFLGYSAISPEYFVSGEKEAEMKAFRESIVGTDNYDEKVEQFSADKHVHSDYPPTYIVYCADDDMVDPKLHAAAMIKALENQEIEYKVEEGKQGGHGFSVGFNTSVDGWIDRADDFFGTILE